MTSGKRSWWGWGDVDQAVAGAEQEALAARVAGLLPGHDLTDHLPPDPRRLGIGATRLVPPASIVDWCSDDVVDRLSHSRGKAFRDVARNLAGDVACVVDLVVRPRDEREVSAVLDWCEQQRIAVIPYGGGSSVVGGVEPRYDDEYAGAVSVDLSRLAGVVEVDRVSRAARIRAATLGPAVDAALASDGFTLRHFPQSYEYSTVGGWLATRAGGHFATLYTHIDDLVESMRVVTPDGVSESRRLPGSGAGPSPDRMFLGSEGTLGVITEAWLRVQDRPRFRARSSVRFADWDRAVTATRCVAQAGLYPANCRLLDATEALLNAGVESPGGLLLLGFESADHPVDGWLDRALEICRDHGGVVDDRSDDADASQQWRGSFLRMPYRRDALARMAVIAETFETACTWDRFPDLHASVTGAANAAFADVTGAGAGLLSCRFTHVYPDGPAPYFGVYAAGRWGAMVSQWDEIKAAVTDAIAAAGGTVTHHHAVGRDHRPWYDRQRPDPFAAAMVAAKRRLDPAGVLNPGVLWG